MATFSNTPRPAYVYEAATDQWIPVGFGPHTHTVTDVTNAFNTTTVTTKGDLVVAAGSNNITRLPAGNTGETLVPDSSTTTGLRWQELQVAGKNAIINGNFDIWQRGTSFSFAAGGATTARYTVDRWSYGGEANFTISRQTAVNTGSAFALRLQRNSGATNTGDQFLNYVMESSTAHMFAGKTATLSFYLRSGANFSGINTYAILRTGTGTDEGVASMYGSGWTGYVQTIRTQVPTTTSTRYSFTFTIPSNVKELGFLLGYNTASGTAGANDWIEYEQIQFEIGSVATPFSRAGGTAAGELALCQRYYTTSIPTGFTVTDFSGMNPGSSSAIGWCSTGSTNDIFTTIQYPVSMRAAPTFVIYSAGNRTVGSVRDAVTGSDIAVSNYSVQTGNNKGFNYMAGFTATTGRPYSFQWTANAEL